MEDNKTIMAAKYIQYLSSEKQLIVVVEKVKQEIEKR